MLPQKGVTEAEAGDAIRQMSLSALDHFRPPNRTAQCGFLCGLHQLPPSALPPVLDTTVPPTFGHTYVKVRGVED